ncbi:hypothetical protein SLS62_011293 [Diatrype stigma]|uniref:EKC/KEOPS complex subunit BUD32 n=1 Tax=Diatrype stigma TaxID=117547 RepID=A0AAN9U4C5_9PEZI
MDNFIDRNLTDFNIPFNEQTLPAFLGQQSGKDLRYDFFAIQDYFLTDVKDIESDKSLHLTLSDGDKYFIRERPLGQGSFGGVDQVFSRLSIEKYARKRVLRGRGSEQSQHYLIQELRELRELHHNHLVQIIGSYTDRDWIAYLMKPVARGTLEEFLSISQPLTSDDKVILRRFYGCLAGAMNYLYAHHVRHRDLTTRNILIDSVGDVYISDFGSAYNWTSKPSSKTKHRNIPTSPDYMAPEISKGEERGTRSDMWSLGVVFLEMTTKLLDHHPVELRRRIRSHAEKTRSQPYPYDNMSVVLSWMNVLGQTNTNHEHDREPLSWARELLHFGHEHRPMPPQLMTYIRESPSFGVFSCLKCESDFEEDAFVYGATTQWTDSKENSRQTREQVEAVFSTYSSAYEVENPPFKRHDSIKKWIVDSSQSEPFAAELTTSHFDDDKWDVEDIPWPQEIMDTQPIDFRPKKEDKAFVDSGLGFLECTSLSSDDDRLMQPFEESSDRSSTQSNEDSHIQTFHGSLDSLFQEEEAPEGIQKQDGSSRESSEMLFYEEDDKSEIGNPWEEASDRSGSENGAEADGQDPLQNGYPRIEPMESFHVNSIEQISEQNPAAVERLPISEEIKPGPVLEESTTVVTDEGYESLPQLQDKDSQNYLPSHQEQEEGRGEEELPTPNLVNADKRKKQAKGSELSPGIPIVPKKQRKKTRFSEQIEHIEGSQPALESNVQDQNTTTSQITIDVPVDDIKPAPSQVSEKNENTSGTSLLSETNMRMKDKEPKTPITPRKRDALVPVDVRKLMDNTWEMASSAPTSVVSADTRSKLSQFFYLIPSSAQIESILSDACKKGSAGVVKTILHRVVSETKPLKFRQFFIPLIYAVQGASTRHNKCVRELLAAGVNPNHRSKKTGLTPLHIAVSHPNFKGYTNLIWLLLSGKIEADPNARDRDGELPLTKLFVGADTTPLEPHKRGALIMLLKEGAKPNITLPGTGSTPLHLAVRRQDKVAVAMLLYKGAAVDARSTSGTTALQMTANQFRAGELGADHAEVLEHLLQHGANVNGRAGALGRTALHWAAIAGCAHAVARLLEAGADVKLQDLDGCDALALAVRHAAKLTAVDGGSDNTDKLADHVEIMLGLAKAANYEEWKLREGKCAVETACRGKDTALLEWLLRAGLSPDSKFRRETVMEFANKKGSYEAKQLLQSKLGSH